MTNKPKPPRVPQPSDFPPNVMIPLTVAAHPGNWYECVGSLEEVSSWIAAHVRDYGPTDAVVGIYQLVGIQRVTASRPDPVVTFDDVQRLPPNEVPVMRVGTLSDQIRKFEAAQDGHPTPLGNPHLRKP